MNRILKTTVLILLIISTILFVVGCNTSVYTISFDVGSYAETIEDIKLSVDEVLDLPILEDFMDDDKIHKFLYWSYEGEAFTLDKMPAHDLSLTAVWDAFFGIKFNVGNSSTVIEPIKASEGSKIKGPSITPKLEGYIFKGWKLDGKPYIFDKMPKSSIILDADYLLLDNQYNQVTSLPKMFVNLENNMLLESVNREVYVDAQVTIISDDYSLYAATSEFKGRGNGSWTGSGPKKGYRFKFDSKESLFGLPASKHWVILAGANFYDPTLAKNAVAFNLARDVFTHIEYTSSANWVEVYVNGLYRGVYLLAEHVRVDKDRVNVDAEFGPLDTGYLIEYDAYGEAEGPEGVAYFRIDGYKYPFVMKAPDFEDYLDEGITLEQYKAQVNFIKDYMTPALRAALNKDLELFETYVDIDSFIDMYLLHELLKNTDTGWSSFFMYKKPGGKLYAGPAWDFDASQGKNRGDTSPYGYYVSEGVMQSSDFTASELYINLMQIPAFKTKVMSRWKEISDTYKTYINNFLSDDFITTNKLAFGINFYRWSDQGPSYGYYPSIQNAIQQWELDTKILRNWIIDRALWFDVEAEK